MCIRDSRDTPQDVQKFAEEALQQLPEIMRELRRRSESFRLDEIEEAMTKLNISPTQSPTLEQPNGTAKLQILQESDINTFKERLSGSQVNIQPVNVTLLPNELENMTSTYELPSHLRTNQPAEKPRVMNQINLTPELYGKITHPVESILPDIPITDGLNITKLLDFIKHLLQLKDLQQLRDNQILQVILPKCRSPLKDRVLESLRYNHPVEELHTTLIRHFIPTGIYEELKRNLVLRAQGTYLSLIHIWTPV